MIKNTIIFILLLIVLALTFLLASVDTTKKEPVAIEEEPSVEIVEIPNLIGYWVSTQDPKSEITYKDDGTVEEIYDGEVLSTGTWEIYQNDTAEYNPSGFFLKTEINEEVYEYAIISLENDLLQLSYLSKGNTLEYKRLEK